MSNREYIHYGHSEFRRELFCEIQNRSFVKPFGGLWASPLWAKNGWKDWCLGENFRVDRLDECFIFTLADGAKVLHIRDVADLVDLPIDPKIQEIFPDGFAAGIYLDFEKLLADGWDAIELHLSEEKFDIEEHLQMRGLYWSLYGWDCDSILVMNPEVIVV